ncbi:hypothetical protein BXZ70DRAFT_362591 [Cristinia sonorae]|uniref:Uncharacterized protein n=1 Tax=Cristinia sonorae TaxID=1940300 RepID=A0A8K0UKF2_9AGAR|nr:hypothetical protein BXZ70DRAFT_362591 [Cristinia sonorae]
MDYSSVFSSGLRAISSRHRRGSSTIETASPILSPTSRTPRRSLSLLPSGSHMWSAFGKRRHGSQGEDIAIPQSSDLSQGVWEPELPAQAQPVLSVCPVIFAEPGIYCPCDHIAYTPSPADTNHLLPPNVSGQQLKGTRVSMGDSFLSITPSPGDNKAFAFPAPRIPVPSPPQLHSRRHTLAPCMNIQPTRWNSDSLPAIPPSPIYETRHSAAGAHGDHESEAVDWRSAVDHLLEHDDH